MALNGKTAVVSGAASGIGQAMTEILLQNGAKVALLDVNEGAGKSLKEALDKKYGKDKTLFLSCNVESEEQIRAAFKRTVEAFGGVDILCNNAGILDEKDWAKMVSINLVGVIKAAYVAVEHMSKLTGGRGGTVVNTASMAGLGPLLTCPVYTATKHGVIGFTRAMAAASEASGYGVRFKAICPGFVQTNLFSNIPDNLGQFSHLADVVKNISDKLGVITPSEIAKGLLELVTEETKNGEVLMVATSVKKYIEFPSVAGIAQDHAD